MEQLTASSKDVDTLWTRVHKTRKGAKNVSVPLSSLEALLMDYHRLYDAVTGTDPVSANKRWRRRP